MATDSVTVSPTFNGDSVPLTAGMIVRLKPGANNNVVRAQADSAPHVQGVNGVVVSGSAAPTGVVTVVCTGRETVQMESGLTPAVGDTVYVSATVAGKGTNIIPGIVLPIGPIADVSAYATSKTVEVDVTVASSEAGAGGTFPGYGGAPPAVAAASSAGAAGTASRSDHTHAGVTSLNAEQGALTVESTGGTVAVTTPDASHINLEVATPFPGYGTAPPLVSAASSAGAASTVSRSDHTHGSTVADWGTAGSVRYFACDGTNGSDANAGWSDASQAAAGAVAVKTLARLLQIVPKFGNGRKARVAIRSGNYASDATLDLSGFAGYGVLIFIGTDTVASAGSTAFLGDTNDTICAGMTTATGMNTAGYNPTAYSVAADGTPTITLQLAGGGAPAFPAAPARPYGCRLRFDVASTTAALRNFADSVLLVPTGGGGAQLVIGEPLPASPVIGDVCYVEMPNVTGPVSTVVINSQGAEMLQLCGLSLGTLITTGGAVKVVGCEAGAAIFDNVLLSIVRIISNLPSGAPVVGMGLRAGGLSTMGGLLNLTDWCDTATTTFQEPELIAAERWAAGGMILYGGSHAIGNNVAETIGTNSSTNHGATCQIWKAATLPVGVSACGLAIYGGYQIGRVKCSNMGAVPGARINGTGMGVTVQAISGGIADGNTDVGLDLSPAGISGNSLGGNGCTVFVVSSDTATGTAGDIRLSDGTIISWATALAGVVDANGNRLFTTNSAPLGATVASAATAVALGAVAPGTVTSSTPTAWTTIVISGVKYLIPLWPST